MATTFVNVTSVAAPASHAPAASSASSTTTSSSVRVSPVARAFFSGAVAGVVADSVLHPLDTVSLRMKIQRAPNVKYSGLFRTMQTILREEGVRGYFGGLGTTLMCAPVCTAIYFGSYETLKATLKPVVGEKSEGVAYFVAGALSEFAISCISVPAEVVKSRLQLGRNPLNASGGVIQKTSNYRHTGHAVASILRQEGVKGFYSGYSACLCVDMLQSACSFLFYEKLKEFCGSYLTRHNDGIEREFTTLESLAMGSCAGGAAAFVSNPFDVITVRLMTQGKDKMYNGIRHCLTETMRREGIRGLWKGAACRTLAVMPSTGISFGVYETIKRFCFQGDLEDFDDF